MAFYRSLVWLLITLGCGKWPHSIAAEPMLAKPRPSDEQSSEGVPAQAGLMLHGPASTWRTPTAGGVQLWADELCFHDWRIQRNVLLGHYRLLDGENRRHARGSFEHCQHELDEIKRERKLPPMKGRAVVTLHGFASWRNKMTPLADYLKENGDFEVFNLAYPSTRLVGAKDFVLMPIIHQFTMFDADVQRYTLNFLEHGYFVSADERKPVEK